MEFSEREVIVLRQIFGEMQLANGRTVREELADLDNLPYIKGFRPGPEQIRLSREEFAEFEKKVKIIAG